MATTSIEIPVGNEEVLEINLEDLEGYDDTILKILIDEKVHLKFFIQFALEYKKKNMDIEFEKFLKAGKQVCNETYVSNQEDQKLLLLNIYAAYLIQSARLLGPGQSLIREKSSRSRDELISEATEILAFAEKINQLDITTLVCRADLMLERNQFRDAEYILKGVLHQDPNNIPALYGMNVIYYKNGDIKSCLSSFQTIFKLCPNIQPDVRLSIGICFQKLGMFKEARASFERALEKNENCVNALALLSIVEKLSSSRIPEISKEAAAKHRKNSTQYIMKAFQLDSKNPIVSLEMAKRFFEKKQYEKAYVFAQTSLKHTEIELMKADAIALKGLILHAQEKYDEALIEFEAAALLNPKSITIDYALGQLYIYKGETEKSTNHLEKVLSVDPDNYNAIKKLATVYSKSLDTRGKSFSYFEKLKKLMKVYKSEEIGLGIELIEHEYLSDYEVLVEWASLLEDTDICLAAKYYEQALQILRNTDGEEIPAELLNNIAVLNQIQSRKANNTSQNVENISSLYIEALQKIQSCLESGNQNKDILATQVTLQYNIASLYEASGEIDRAEKLFTQLIEKHPAYTDALLRIAMIHLKQNKPDDAIRLVKEITDVNSENVNAHLLLGNAFLAKKDYKSSKKAFENILRGIDKHNSYALCALGNLNCMLISREPSKTKKAEFVKRAYEYFDKSLRLKPTNLYAAIGMGILFAEQGQFETSKTIFSQIQETVPAIGALLNLSHVLMDMGDAKNAITMYETILKKIPQDKQGFILQCLAKASFTAGKEEKNPLNMRDSITYLEKALELEPESNSLKFNLALLQQQNALVLSEQSLEKRSIEAMKESLLDLEKSEKIFTELSQLSQENQKGFSLKNVLGRLSFCKSTLRIVQRKIHETEVLEKQRSERMISMREAREKSEKEKLEKELIEKLRLEEEQSQIEKARRELLEKVKVENEKAKLIDEPKKIKRVKELASEDDTQESKKRKKKERSRAIIESSDDEEVEEKMDTE